jgi:hypothetical protein
MECSIRKVGDHGFDRLKNTPGGEVNISRNPLGHELSTLDGDSDTLPPINQQYIGSPLGSGPRCA